MSALYQYLPCREYITQAGIRKDREALQRGGFSFFLDSSFLGERRVTGERKSGEEKMDKMDLAGNSSWIERNSLEIPSHLGPCQQNV